MDPAATIDKILALLRSGEKRITLLYVDQSSAKDNFTLLLKVLRNNSLHDFNEGISYFDRKEDSTQLKAKSFSGFINYLVVPARMKGLRFKNILVDAKLRDMTQHQQRDIEATIRGTLEVGGKVSFGIAFPAFKYRLFDEAPPPQPSLPNIDNPRASATDLAEEAKMINSEACRNGC